MNDDDGTIISDTTIEDSIMDTHTFPFDRPSEQPLVIIECKPTAPKSKGILFLGTVDTIYMFWTPGWLTIN
jgi:hypothetical protein